MSVSWDRVRRHLADLEGKLCILEARIDAEANALKPADLARLLELQGKILAMIEKLKRSCSQADLEATGAEFAAAVDAALRYLEEESGA